ncbi:hypothetical protein [Streptomyces sp. Amel2xC10]|uniref:hypothetical protein n=1 Tax=Streptomyces sp. Amel2xC10 TaxID=1305826 RepID=UPI000A08C622|nr:hypothetical protein [Streptomyces sp. Amel2xC10]SMF55251.1 hypothetical protein SAMN02745830_04413 [Streptomyces sp. Amel2xC10]
MNGVRAVGLLGAGVLMLLAGGGVIAVGAGAPGLDTRTFTRISCNEKHTAKGGTVWHCFGMTAAQIEAAEEQQRQAREDALRGGYPDLGPVPRTRLTFVDHDGRQDPAEVTATRVGSRWIAHAPGVVGTGVALLAVGAGVAAASAVRLRATRPHAEQR